MIPSWKKTRKDCFSEIPLIEGDVKHPICTFWWLLTSDSDVKSRQTKNERNDKTVAMATKPLSTMRFHRSLGIFVIIFTRFSLISQSILNRFSCNFAGTTCNYSGDCPKKFVKFERVFLKLLVRLVVNLLEYFKMYSFRRQFRHQFSTVYHEILQAPFMVLRRLPCKLCKVWENTSKVINEISVKFDWVFQKLFI